MNPASVWQQRFTAQRSRWVWVEAVAPHGQFFNVLLSESRLDGYAIRGKPRPRTQIALLLEPQRAAELHIGQRLRLHYERFPHGLAWRPVRLGSINTPRWREAPSWSVASGSWLARTVYRGPDQRYRPLIFLAYGLPSRSAAIAVTIAGTPQLPTGYALEWAEVVQVDPTVRDQSSWARYPGDGLYGRDFEPVETGAIP